MKAFGAIVLILALAIVGFISYLTYQVNHPETEMAVNTEINKDTYLPKRYTLLHVKLPNADLIEYDGISVFHRGFGWVGNQRFLSWNHQNYLIADGDEIIADSIEMRCRTDHQGIWLIDRTKRPNRVVASLDLRSRKFLDLHCCPYDPSETLDQQSVDHHQPQKRIPIGQRQRPA